MLRCALLATTLLIAVWRSALPQDGGPFLAETILPQPFEKQPFHPVRLPSWVEETTGVGYTLSGKDRSERELSVEHVPEGNGVSDRTDDLLLSWIVADAVMKLSPEHRAVLLECYYRGASVAEAARRLDIPTGTVKSRSHYALRALALALEEMGVSP